MLLISLVGKFITQGEMMKKSLATVAALALFGSLAFAADADKIDLMLIATNGTISDKQVYVLSETEKRQIVGGYYRPGAGIYSYTKPITSYSSTLFQTGSKQISNSYLQTSFTYSSSSKYLNNYNSAVSAGRPALSPTGIYYTGRR